MTPTENPVNGYIWHGEDDPGRLDTAAASFGPDRLRAHGTSRTGSYAMSWALVTGEQWITKHLAVTVHGQGWSRRLDLTRTENGVWASQAEASGEATLLPPPGIIDGADFKDALDCDLGLCPFTNAMPVLRLNLLSPVASDKETVLTMAFVEVPSLRVIPSRQVYSRTDPTNGNGPHKVRYSTEDRTFTAELTLDPQGVVTGYPGLARLAE